jgi:chromosome segregation ATPase
MDTKLIDEKHIKILALRDQKDGLNASLKRLNEILEETEKEFTEMLIQNEKNRWDVEGYQSLTLRSKRYWSAVDKDKLVAYMIENDLKNMLSVHSQTLTGWANELPELETMAAYEEQYGLTAFEKITVTKLPKKGA